MNRQELIDRYKAGGAEVRQAVTEAQAAGTLDQRPAPGEWTAREVVHHLADSELTSAVRLRRVLAEDDPAIAGYDENEFARRLHYDRPVDASLDAMDAARRSSIELVESLEAGEWARTGTHSESGEYSVGHWLSVYAEHPYDHAAQIRAAAAPSHHSSGSA
ncbi:MAG TPA: DinB family protein [Acidimicrobiales bacterium]|jgi:hypothetical protein|nr:DinB family protein [Acidimicrobiales bacterium]